MTEDARVGLVVTHRRYITHADAHYGGNLVDGAFTLALFGDVATELSIRTDGDEGLFAGYSEVTFLAPVRAGDVLEVSATLTAVGRRSRTVDVRIDDLLSRASGRQRFGSRSARRTHRLDSSGWDRSRTRCVLTPAPGRYRRCRGYRSARSTWRLGGPARRDTSGGCRSDVLGWPPWPERHWSWHSPRTAGGH